MANAIIPRQEFHCILGFGDSTLWETKTVMTNRTVADSGEIETERYKSGLRQCARQLNVNTAGTNSMHNACVQENDARQSMLVVNLGNTCNNSDK
jgi:hypothetical protein